MSYGRLNLWLSQVPDKDLEDEPVRDQKKVHSEPASPAMSESPFTNSRPGEVEWESEDDTLYTRPNSRRLSVCEREAVLDMGVVMDSEGVRAIPAEALSQSHSEVPCTPSCWHSPSL